MNRTRHLAIPCDHCSNPTRYRIRRDFIQVCSDDCRELMNRAIDEARCDTCGSRTCYLFNEEEAVVRKITSNPVYDFRTALLSRECRSCARDRQEGPHCLDCWSRISVMTCFRSDNPEQKDPLCYECREKNDELYEKIKALRTPAEVALDHLDTLRFFVAGSVGEHKPIDVALKRLLVEIAREERSLLRAGAKPRALRLKKFSARTAA